MTRMDSAGGEERVGTNLAKARADLQRGEELRRPDRHALFVRAEHEHRPCKANTKTAEIAQIAQRRRAEASTHEAALCRSEEREQQQSDGATTP